MLYRLWSDRKSLAVRLIGVLLLVAVCAAVLPIPVRLPAASESEKDQSEPYPCRDRPCGCRSAKQCWAHCCCFTSSQKLSWAKEHGVKPPDFVVAAAARECCTDSPVVASCCSRKPQSQPACCAHGNAADSRCDSKKVATQHASHGRGADRRPKQGRPATMIITSLALRCQGQLTSWYSLPWTILPDAPTVARRFEQPGRLDLAGTPQPPEISDRPPTPPPRLLRALSHCLT